MKEKYLEELKLKVNTYSKKDWAMIYKAYQFAEKYHHNQLRASGDEYIVHPLSVAIMMAEMKADCDTICASLLHDVLEDTPCQIEEIEKEFNSQVAYLVDGVTKITKLSLNDKNEVTASYIRRIIVSIRQDARIVIIKLVDRLHNMRTLEYKNNTRQKEIALETLEIYVPMAYYMGAYKIKEELENLSFKYIKPDTYRDVTKELNQIKQENTKMLKEMANHIKKELNKENIKCHIEIVFKNAYSVYKKMITKSTIDNIHDLLGIKVVVKSTRDCYLALMIIHKNYPPLTLKFKDYIVKPKTNMYRSLHTTVFAKNNRLVQFQIRTRDMEKVANSGLTSYWLTNRSFAKIKMQHDLESEYQFFKSIEELDSSIQDNIEFVNKIKVELFSKNVYVRSTSGEVIELPYNSTPIDFAYKIHTDIGNTMVAAIVNDEVVPFDYQLKNNDRVRIITDDKAFVNKEDWLDKVVTTNARKKIMDFLKNNMD